MFFNRMFAAFYDIAYHDHLQIRFCVQLQITALVVSWFLCNDDLLITLKEFIFKDGVLRLQLMLEVNMFYCLVNGIRNGDRRICFGLVLDLIFVILSYISQCDVN